METPWCKFSFIPNHPPVTTGVLISSRPWVQPLFFPCGAGRQYLFQDLSLLFVAAHTNSPVFEVPRSEEYQLFLMFFKSVATPETWFRASQFETSLSRWDDFPATGPPKTRKRGVNTFKSSFKLDRFMVCLDDAVGSKFDWCRKETENETKRKWCHWE